MKNILKAGNSVIDSKYLDIIGGNLTQNISGAMDNK